MYTAICTQLTDSSPAGYKHQCVHDVLNQYGGGTSGADQPQRTAPTRVWSGPHQGPNGFEKEGGSLRFQRRRDFLLKEKGGDGKGVLDFPPDEDRPGGHIGEEDPIAGFFLR